MTEREPVTYNTSEMSSIVLLVAGAGRFTHAAPVLELGRILASRGHRVEFATHRGQEKWVKTSYYAFISRVHTMGPSMSLEVEVPHYLAMQQSDPLKDFKEVFKAKHTVDAFWTSDYAHLKEIVSICKPDMIIADFFVDAVKDIQIQTGIPIAMVWPQMPYGMVGASYIPGIPFMSFDSRILGLHISHSLKIWS